MTIHYCSFAIGDDDSGDGSAANPYKTITKASTGLAGGDEVRVAKSPDPTALSGTLAWVNGSASVSTSVDLTGFLAPHDFIGKNITGETWWEIATITSNMITLVAAYSGPTETVGSYKLGITDTGTAATATTQIQVMSASGSSGSSKLTISGGWDLNTEEQTGKTWYFQSGGSRYGYGLYSSSKNYINISKIGFLRYTRGISASASCGWTLTSITCNGNSNNGLYGANCHDWHITDLICNANSISIYVNASFNWFVYQCKCSANSSYGFSLANLYNWRIIDAETLLNASAVIYQSEYCYDMVLFGLKHDKSVWSTVVGVGAPKGVSHKTVSLGESESGGLIRNRIYFNGGYVQDNTAEARSDKCVQFNPRSATNCIEQRFNLLATAGVDEVVTLYAKMDDYFDGNVSLELWFNGVCITGPNDVSSALTTDYTQLTVVADGDNIPVDGVLELIVKVYGTSGCIYVDDLGYS